MKKVFSISKAKFCNVESFVQFWQLQSPTQHKQYSFSSATCTKNRKIHRQYTVFKVTFETLKQRSENEVWKTKLGLKKTSCNNILIQTNRPFPSSLVFQSESKCEIVLMEMILICMKMKLHAELIFMWKFSHLDSFWNSGTREFGNGLLRTL